MMIVRYLITFGTFFAIDLVWLGVVAPKFYKAQIGHLMSDQVNWPAAIIFYLVYIVALLVFVIYPSVEANSLQKAILYGALLGFAMYATYDLTNLATLSDWPLTVTIVDLIWGTFVTATTCAVATLIIQKFNL